MYTIDLKDGAMLAVASTPDGVRVCIDDVNEIVSDVVGQEDQYRELLSAANAVLDMWVSGSVTTMAHVGGTLSRLSRAVVAIQAP